MFELKRSDKDLLSYLGGSLFGFAVMLAFLSFLGEVHGLIGTVIMVIIQSTHSHVRLRTLEREMAELRRGRDPLTT